MNKEVLARYEVKLAGWRKAEQPVPDLKDLTFNEALLIAMQLNPIRKAESVRITRALLKTLHTEKVLTVRGLAEELEVTNPPLYKRLKLLAKYSLVRKDGEYYLATPRLAQLMENYKALLG